MDDDHRKASYMEGLDDGSNSDSDSDSDSNSGDSSDSAESVGVKQDEEKKTQKILVFGVDVKVDDDNKKDKVMKTEEKKDIVVDVVDDDDDMEKVNGNEIEEDFPTLKKNFDDNILSLRKSKEFQELLIKARGKSNDVDVVLGCNEMIYKIDEKLMEGYKILQKVYSKKFPELETLVTVPIDYVRTVKIIGNEMDMTSVDLQNVLPRSLVLSVTLAGTTSIGDPLDENELEFVQYGCDEIMYLEETKEKILLPFVSDRISMIAPNISALVGSETAAHVLGIAGNIEKLANTPSGNIAVLGKKENTSLSGFSRIASMRHSGVVFFCPLVQECIPKYRRQALRVVSGRLALAARVDFAKSSPDGAQGRAYYEEIKKKIEKWSLPKQGKNKKALPIPVEKKKTNRGGKRIRKLKERYKRSHMEKLANRIQFGSSNSNDEYGDAAMGFDTGMIGTNLSKYTKKLSTIKGLKATITPGIVSSIKPNEHPNPSSSSSSSSRSKKRKTN